MNASTQDSLRGIKTVFFDVDHVIHHYNDEYAREFSVATAQSFLELYPDLAERFEFDDLVQMAVNSYLETGKTTTWFKENFGIDERKLYKHHHDALCEDGGFIDQQFASGKIKIDPELSDLLIQVKNLGIQLVALTNGTERYAEKVLGCHGIGDLFDHKFGIDSVDNPKLNDKRHGAFWNDIFKKINLWNRSNKQDEAAIIDDTCRNLRAPKERFNMFACFKRRDVNQEAATATVDMSVNDVKEFLKEIILANSNKPIAQARLVNQ